VIAGLAGALVLGLLVGVALPDRSAAIANQGAQGEDVVADLAAFDAPDLDSADLPAAAGPADPAAAGPRTDRQKERRLGLKPGQTVLLGTISSVGNGKLTVTRDSGGDATVNADQSTRVGGKGTRAVGELKTGQRVAAKIADGRAVGILVIQSHWTGTVTTVNGDAATVVRPDGQAQDLDLAAVANKPKVGDVVIVVGTPADGGTKLKVSALRQVPHS
jgi:hypothetical protein